MEWLIYSVKSRGFSLVQYVRFIFSEKYFEMNKKQCRESLDIYKKFIERTDRVSQYLKIAEVRIKFTLEFLKALIFPFRLLAWNEQKFRIYLV